MPPTQYYRHCSPGQSMVYSAHEQDTLLPDRPGAAEVRNLRHRRRQGGHEAWRAVSTRLPFIRLLLHMEERTNARRLGIPYQRKIHFPPCAEGADLVLYWRCSSTSARGVRRVRQAAWSSSQRNGSRSTATGKVDRAAGTRVAGEMEP